MSRTIALPLIFLSGFSFLNNFFWESVHAVYLYRGHDIDASAYLPMMLSVSAKDSLIILALYLLLCLLNRSFFWLEKFTAKNISGFILLSLLTAVAIESVSVAFMARWSYREALPTSFGIGLSPLLQLTCTGLLSLWLSKKILYDCPLLSGHEKTVSPISKPPEQTMRAAERHTDDR